MLTREQDELRRNGISLSKKIGAGSFSSVYSGGWKVEDQVIKVAVKIMRLDQLTDDRFERFYLGRELAIARQVDHNNIAKLHQAFMVGRSAVMVSQLYECDLLQYLQQRGAVSERVARRLLREICSAVAYLHDLNIVHRDLKTENVFLSPEGEIKLGDFGFARQLESDSSLCETKCGSDGYIAPELVREDEEKYDAKLADVWSVGVILFTMVTKSMPFDKQIMNMMNRNRRTVLRFHPKSLVSGKLRELLSLFLAFEPADRIHLSQVRNHPWYSTRHDLSLTGNEPGPSNDRHSSVA